MILTDQERGMGLLVVTCLCCGNVYKAHQMSNALSYSLIPNYGCEKCKGVPLTGRQGTGLNNKDAAQIKTPY